VRGSETRIELVPIVANLRHDLLDELVTEASLQGVAPADYPFATELAFCHRLALVLKARREQMRGKPETFNRPDYNFRLEGNTAEPDGSEAVRISTRRRGAPLDLIVAEAMILANSTWGGWLAERSVPGIYRSQASLAPGIKVRMGTRPAPHAGMGVAQYSWATSPLRRYVDLVNQWQLIACVRHGKAAALAAPFKPKDTALLAVISGFDAAYTAYNDFQHGVERFWTLRWLEQNGVTELEAAVMSQGLVRAETLPLVFRVPGTDNLPRHARVRVRITGRDLLTLELFAQLVARLDDVAGDAGVADDGEDESGEGNALKLAIDVNEAGEDAAPAVAAG
jgi:exoribonuclease-2